MKRLHANTLLGHESTAPAALLSGKSKSTEFEQSTFVVTFWPTQAAGKRKQRKVGDGVLLLQQHSACLLDTSEGGRKWVDSIKQLVGTRDANGIPPYQRMVHQGGTLRPGDELTIGRHTVRIESVQHAHLLIGQVDAGGEVDCPTNGPEPIDEGPLQKKPRRLLHSAPNPSSSEPPFNYPLGEGVPQYPSSFLGAAFTSSTSAQPQDARPYHSSSLGLNGGAATTKTHSPFHFQFNNAPHHQSATHTTGFGNDWQPSFSGWSGPSPSTEQQNHGGTTMVAQEKQALGVTLPTSTVLPSNEPCSKITVPPFSSTTRTWAEPRFEALRSQDSVLSFIRNYKDRSLSHHQGVLAAIPTPTDDLFLAGE
jgi:hypothetical protein